MRWKRSKRINLVFSSLHSIHVIRKIQLVCQILFRSYQEKWERSSIGDTFISKQRIEHSYQFEILSKLTYNQINTTSFYKVLFFFYLSNKCRKSAVVYSYIVNWITPLHFLLVYRIDLFFSPNLYRKEEPCILDRRITHINYERKGSIQACCRKYRFNESDKRHELNEAKWERERREMIKSNDSVENLKSLFFLDKINVTNIICWFSSG